MKASQAPVTFGILVAIFIMFGVELLTGIPLADVGNIYIPKLAALGMITPTTIADGEYWRLFAAMFIHIGILHLLLNSWALYQLGGVFEIMFGPKRFAVTYFVSGLIASITSALRTAAFSAGASGAIFGILGALIVAIRRSPKWRHQQWARSLTHQLILWAGINIVIGTSFPGIDNAAHMGGFVAGLILGFLPHRVAPPPARNMTIETGADGDVHYTHRDEGM